MKLVVGLGNPGRQYESTRHNVGFDVAAEVARRWAAGKVRHRFRGECVEVVIGGEQVLVLCPSTYMNLSGGSVQEAVSFFKLDPATDVLVVCDDLNLPLGKLRLRASGSAGGQKGLEDILRRLGTADVARLRIGIGQAPPNWNWADYVLSKFTADERAEMERAVAQAADAVETWLREGIGPAANRHNKTEPDDKQTRPNKATRPEKKTGKQDDGGPGA